MDTMLYLRLIFDNLAITLLLMLSLNFQPMKYVLRCTALLLFQREMILFLHRLGLTEYVQYMEVIILVTLITLSFYAAILLVLADKLKSSK